MGIPADAKTRRLRRAAHVALDEVAERLGMSKKARYRWLRELTCKSRHDAHIGRFTAEECQELINIISSKFDSIGFRPKCRGCGAVDNDSTEDACVHCGKAFEERTP